MDNQTVELLSGFTLMQGLSEEEILKIIDKSKKRQFSSGDIVCRQGEVGESMFLIISGRVRMSLMRGDGAEQTLNVLQQGDHLGEMSLLIGGTRTLTATAIMDSNVLEITKQDFYELVDQVPHFSINLSRTIAGWLREELSGKVVREKLEVIGLIWTSPKSRKFTQQIGDFFVGKNKKISVLRSETADTQIDTSTFIKAAENCDHVFLEGSHDTISPTLLMQCERVWWFIDVDDEAPLGRVAKLMGARPELANRLQLVWVQPRAEELAPVVSYGTPVLPDLRFQYDPDSGLLRKADLARLYHVARGVQIGLALGGGGARCLAHIGVLAAMEENELYFDRIAGTSAGAIIAACHGAGMEPKLMKKLFKKEMTPPKWVQFIPKAKRWYLVSLFRYGLIEQRFRRYLKDYTFDQLFLPVNLVSVDLIIGEEIIRSTGDVVAGVLESINHPLFGKPIFRENKALVDGGVLINVPSSVLNKQHVDKVISVDVSTKLSSHFGDHKADASKSAGYFSTLNRVLDVTQRGLAKLHLSGSDFVIKPDTCAYSFEDFTRVNELFTIGYNTAMEIMPELKERYEKIIES